MVAIGSSWGGLSALKIVLGGLPPSFPLPVVIAQHRSADSQDAGLARYYSAFCELPVCSVEDKQSIEPGTVYFAPPDYHLLVEGQAFALSVDDRVQFSRPSVDVLMESAVDSFGEAVIGVILTGTNEDGAEGLAAVEAAGGCTIVQAPETAARSEMPQAALRAVRSVHAVLPLDEIPTFLVKLAWEPG